MWKRIWIGVVLFCVGFAAIAQDDDRQSIERLMGPEMAGLLSDDAQVRANSYNEWRNRQQLQVRFLVKLAGTEKPRYDNEFDSRELAIRMLGSLGGCNPVLFRNLDWKYPGAITRGGLLAQYPCADVVANCRPEGLSKLLDYLSKLLPRELSEKRVVLGALVVLIGHGRGNDSEAIAFVEKHVADATGDNRANLDRILAAVKQGLQSNLDRLKQLPD